MKLASLWRWPFICLLMFSLVGCVLLPAGGWNRTIPISTRSQPFTDPREHCSGAFVEHILDHTTTVPGGNDVRMFEANGGGVAINDLDNDGDLDIVLANHAGPNSILWNEGNLNFRKSPLGDGDSRAANIVDVDGDGWLDIVFTRTASAPNYWHNDRNGGFTRELFAGVDKPLYAINWGDLDGDSDLDFVGATYDAGLLTSFGNDFLMSNQAGVYVYLNENGIFQAERLADQAQALALALLDLNGDQHLDIQVGNDFALPDYVWLWSAEGWVQSDLYSTTTHSTMSLDFADVDNNGQSELFASDMHPYQDDPETMAAWQPVMEPMMADPHPEGDPQTMANVFQMADELATYNNMAPSFGLDATGWSWSSKFGDLDQDGFVDLYVVNGFMEMSTFGHLPNHELVEENQALRNEAGVGFRPVPQWGLGATASGRGMSMADLDNDGDLDIVINNLRAPAALFDNQLCQGQSVQVDLRWPGAANSHAIAAQLVLHTDAGPLYREIKAASGYLSGDPARIHFGFAESNELTLEIIWPDGQISMVGPIEADTLITVSRP